MEDFVTLDLKGGSLAWVEHTVEGELFKPRKGAAMCAAGDAVYVFGGVHRNEDADAEVLLDDFFVLRAEGKVVTAEAIPLKGAVCRGARLRHARLRGEGVADAVRRRVRREPD